MRHVLKLNNLVSSLQFFIFGNFILEKTLNFQKQKVHLVFEEIVKKSLSCISCHPLRTIV